MRYTYILFALLLVGCGSRKVERHNKSSLEETNTTIQEQTKVTEIKFDRKKVFEIMRELNIRNGSITFNTDGSITAKGDEIDLKNKEVGEESESGAIKEENTNLNIDQDTISKDDQNDVKIDRKQFNWWGIITPLGILIFVVLLVIYFIRKKWKMI